MPWSGFPDRIPQNWRGSFLQVSAAVNWVSSSWRSVLAGDYYNLFLLQLAFHSGSSRNPALLWLTLAADRSRAANSLLTFAQFGGV